MLQLLWKTIWQFLHNLNTDLPYYPAILLLTIYPRGMKTYIYKKDLSFILSDRQPVDNNIGHIFVDPCILVTNSLTVHLQSIGHIATSFEVE